MERMENDMTAKRVYVEEGVSSPSVGRVWKGRTDIMKDCFEKSDLDVRQARRMV